MVSWDKRTCILDDLIKYGPAFIQGFKVEIKFTLNSWQHLGDTLIESNGLHAMILIGHRFENGQSRYLLQNW